MAFGAGTINSIGGAVSDLFSADALRTKAKGSRIEAQEYDLAGDLALRNKQFAETSTEIKEMQTQRGINQTLGQQAADVASSGFEASGSALDLLRDSASQGALHKAVVGQQGLIEEAGYEEQSKSYTLMASASRMAADADEKAARGATITAGFKAAAAVASIFDVGGSSGPGGGGESGASGGGGGGG